MTRCLLLLVDGLRPDVAERALAAGELPHLAQIVERGGAGRAITAFPSTTSVAYLPFLTGCTPGRCNVPSIRWLERERYDGRWWRSRDALRSYCGYQAGRLDGDIGADVRTIFQLVPGSIGLFTMITRGLDRARDPARLARKIWGALAHFTAWHQPSDDAVAAHLLHAVDGPARFVFAQFPAVDGYTHQQGPEGPAVRRALRRVDAVVGCVVERLRARRELDDTLLLLVSDHGAAPVHTHLDLAEWFRQQGVRTLAHPTVWTRSAKAAVMVAGNGSAMVYAQPHEPREGRWPLERLRAHGGFGVHADLVARLVREPAVAFVAAESADQTVVLMDARGTATVRRSGEWIAYDPGSADPLAEGGPRCASARAWLERTAEGPYPDAAVQLLDQFRSPRTGDLIVIAREGYDFRRRFEVPEHRAGHGSLIGAHMRTPLWSSAPLPGRVLRTVDLFPAILDWLDVPAPVDVDGELVWAPGAQARQAAAGARPPERRRRSQSGR